MNLSRRVNFVHNNVVTGAVLFGVTQLEAITRNTFDYTFI